MREIKLGGETISVQGGPWALVLYEREFGPDHIDFFADAKKAVPGPMSLSGFVNPLFLLRITWAMAKNANDDFPHFEPWMKSLNIPMQEGAPWSEEVISALNAEIFRCTEDTESVKK